MDWEEGSVVDSRDDGLAAVEQLVLRPCRLGADLRVPPSLSKEAGRLSTKS